MLSYLTANDIANTARLTRTLFAGAIVIAEGDTDVRVYKRLFSKTGCRFVPSNGKPNAITATLILDGDHFLGLLTIVDADFDRLESIDPPSPNILCSDAHDLETMILRSSSLSKVLSEMLSVPKARTMPAPVLDLAFQAALPLGYFRWLSSSYKENFGLKFNGIVLDRFIAMPSFVTDIDSMIKEVARNTGSCSLDVARAKANLHILAAGGHDKWEVCSGHDLVEVIFLALKHHWGNHRARTITADVLGAMLRLAYDKTDFRSSNLYRQIRDWETKNPPFQVLN
jgi:hypothetical protein